MGRIFSHQPQGQEELSNALISINAAPSRFVTTRAGQTHQVQADLTTDRVARLDDGKCEKFWCPNPPNRDTVARKQVAPFTQ